MSLLACLAGDLFLEGRTGDFRDVCEALLALATGPDERDARAASAALSSLNAWDVGRPLAEHVFGDDEELASLAGKVLPFLEQSLTVVDIVDRLRGEEAVRVTPQLAEVARSLGEPLLAALRESLEANLREEVYVRILDLLGMMGGNAAVEVVKSVENNPIPGVRAHAMRTLAGMSPGDPTLLPHFLRALRDQYPGRLTYVTATDRRLSEIRNDEEVAEFNELFAHHRYYLGPLNAADARCFIASFTRREPVTFDETDIAFILEWSGGHPGLLEAVCRELGAVTGQPIRDPTQNRIIHRQVAERIPSSLNVRSECTKIWRNLDPSEQAALLALGAPGQQTDAAALASLEQKGVLYSNHEEQRLFARAFSEFVQRQRLLQRTETRGIVVDVDAGEVYVDGRPTPPLTNLEYRLLLLLYGHMGKICDKYQVVQAVWGEAYLDEVDDARIEKLVSRLRQKIEPDPMNPRYLLTIRGRGYRLVGG